MKNIILIGMPGCGKSTFGKKLAEEMHRDFYDADEVLVMREKRTIVDFFAESEEAFRTAETRTLQYLAEKEGVIIATGGGAVTRAENMELLSKNGVIVFIDRKPEKIYETIKRHGMTDQMLVKSKISEKVLSVLENLCPELPFIPIVSEEHPMHKGLMKRNINYIGAEVLFEKDDSPLAGKEFIDMMHNDGKLVWVNSIIYDFKDQLSGGHSDDTALTVSEDYGWGWLADRGFDFIQTDWTMMLVDYLKKSNKYYR